MGDPRGLTAAGFAAALSAAAPSAAGAQALTCASADAQTVCVPVITCLEADDGPILFRGRALGVTFGAVEVSSVATDAAAGTDGDVYCAGSWRILSDGSGYAEGACTNNRTFALYYDYQDQPTGTASGVGRTNLDEPFLGVSGLNAVEFIRRWNADPNRPPFCGGQPLSS